VEITQIKQQRAAKLYSGEPPPIDPKLVRRVILPLNAIDTDL
jgi:hypothetical protein